MNSEVVIAVNTCYFLNDIRLYRYVLGCSPAGYGNGKLVIIKLGSKSESRKSSNYSVVVDFDTCIFINKTLVKAELNGIVMLCVLIRQ